VATRHKSEADEVYYARLRSYEPARRLKLDADVASNNDPEHLALLEPGVRQRLTEKDAKAKAMLTPFTADQQALRRSPRDPPVAVARDSGEITRN